MGKSRDGRGLRSELFLDSKQEDLQAAWAARERDASLLRAGGAHAIAGAMRVYALEIRIKLIICNHLGVKLLPKVCKTHDLSELMVFTGLWAEFANPDNDAVRGNRDVLVEFSKKRLNDLRYLPSMPNDEEEFEVIAMAPDDPETGVLQWLSNRP